MTLLPALAMQEEKGCVVIDIEDSEQDRVSHIRSDLGTFSSWN
jgi:hypothetical protein